MNAYESNAAMPSDGSTFEDIVAELMDDEEFAALFDFLLPIPSRQSVLRELTEQQLRALNRKHLLMMLRDLEEELQQAEEEKENLLLAYRAGLRQRLQAYQAV